MAGRGACSIALSGGSTPRSLYHLMGNDPWRKRFDWSRIELFQVDERAVPIDHPDSNFGMIERELLRSAQIPESNVHRVHTELGAQAAAEEYESQLRKSFVAAGIPQFDVLLLGIGEDGHTASLFPGAEALHESCRLVLGYTVGVPFDEGSLIGSLTLQSTWPADDWRSTYFVPENLESSVAHADAIKPLVPAGVTLAEMALRFILSNQDVSTVIPGMRKPSNVEANTAASEAGPLPPGLLSELRKHRWDRKPTEWSQ